MTDAEDCYREKTCCFQAQASCSSKSPWWTTSHSLKRSRRKSVQHQQQQRKKRQQLRASAAVAEVSNSRRVPWCTGTTTSYYLYARNTRIIAAATAVMLWSMTSVATTSLPIKDDGPSSLWDMVSENPDYSKLVACLDMADASIVEALRASAEYPATLFAPSDSAFEEPDWGYGVVEAMAVTANNISTTTMDSSIFNSRWVASFKRSSKKGTRYYWSLVEIHVFAHRWYY